VGEGIDLNCASIVDGGLRPSCRWARDRGQPGIGACLTESRAHLSRSGVGVGDRGASGTWAPTSSASVGECVRRQGVITGDAGVPMNQAGIGA
jgi:hypothetical protein